MLKIGKSSPSPAEHMRRELGESWDHFVQAATHAANGVGSSVGPRTNQMKLAASRGWESTAGAIAPLAEAYRAGAKDARRGAAKLKAKATKTKAKEAGMSRKKVGLAVGLVATGAAVGAASALVIRRRKQQQWSEFADDAAFGDSLESLGPKDDLADQAGGALGKTSSKISDKASKAMDKTADKLHSAAASLSKEPGATEVQGVTTNRVAAAPDIGETR